MNFSQIDALLSEKTNVVIEKENIEDKYDSLKDDSEITKTRLKTTKETLQKRTEKMMFYEKYLVFDQFEKKCKRRIYSNFMADELP